MIEIKNRKINDYIVEKTLNAGIVLVGSEIKSLISKEVGITGAWVNIVGDRKRPIPVLVNSYFKEHRSTNIFDTSTYESNRDRLLLLKKSEIKFLQQELQAGRVLIGSKIFLPKDSKKYKLQISICRPMKKWDKRESEKLKNYKKEIK